MKALEQEIELLKTLNHRNIVKYLGTHKDKNKLNIFLEYVPGGSLENIYKTYPMNENLIRVYTKQILEGVEYLHINNVIHRDLKAANILVDSKGTCKLADFGSSKKFKESLQKTQYQSLCGTPYWMPPEVITQSGHNRHADIWSVGCTIYEMLLGHPPWNEKKDIFQVFLSIATATEPPRIPANYAVSAELRSFLDCCFQLKPERRANIYELLRHKFIDNTGKIQKYHFTLDKIDEELTPNQTNSEYRSISGGVGHEAGSAITGDNKSSGHAHICSSSEKDGATPGTASQRGRKKMPRRGRKFFPGSATSNEGSGEHQRPSSPSRRVQSPVKECD